MGEFSEAYLSAKQSIDDEALHPRVWLSFAAAFGEVVRTRAVTGARANLLDVGCGTGSTLARIVRDTVLSGFDYTGLDEDLGLLNSVPRRRGASERGIRVTTLGLDLESFVEATPAASFDGVVSHAFLDLVDIDRVVPRLLRLLRPGGVFYASLVYDGLSFFLPSDEADSEVLSAYEASMQVDGRTGRFAGRRLLELVVSSGLRIRASGPSDWLVLPGQAGHGPARRDFLERILGFVEVGTGGGCPHTAAGWLERRRRQLAEGSLGFGAHQWDVVGTV